LKEIADEIETKASNESQFVHPVDGLDDSKFVFGHQVSLALGELIPGVIILIFFLNIKEIICCHIPVITTSDDLVCPQKEKS